MYDNHEVHACIYTAELWKRPGLNLALCAYFTHFLRLILIVDVPDRAIEPMHASIHRKVVPQQRHHKHKAEDGHGVIHISRTWVGSDGKQENSVHERHE